MIKRKIRFLYLFFLLAFIFSVNNVLLAKSANYNHLSDSDVLKELHNSGKSIIVLNGHEGMFYAQKEFPNGDINIVGDNVIAISNLLKGKSDCYIFDENILKYDISRGLKGVRLINLEHEDIFKIGFGVSKNTKFPQLKEKLNAFITEAKKEKLVLKYTNNWLTKDYIPEKNKNTNMELPVITVATVYNTAPYNCVVNNEVAGIDIDLLNEFAKRINARIEYKLMEFSGLISALEAGSVDLAAAAISITEERKEIYNFSDAYAELNLGLLIKDDSEKDKNTNIWNTIRNRFRNTFIVENRYLLIFKGLLVTCVLSVSAGLLGASFAFILVIIYDLKNKYLRKFIDFIAWLVLGIPSLVFLMFVYYVIFGNINLDPLLIAILAFGTLYGFVSFNLMKTAIESVDVGQCEASLALGYTKWQTFFYIVIPQASKRFLPLMKVAFINLVNMTATVGFITVQDLTKTIDIIRGRTLEAFFPILVSAVLYFMLEQLLLYIISKIEVELNIVGRKRTIKGVSM